MWTHLHFWSRMGGGYFTENAQLHSPVFPSSPLSPSVIWSTKRRVLDKMADISLCSIMSTETPTSKHGGVKASREIESCNNHRKDVRPTRCNYNYITFKREKGYEECNYLLKRRLEVIHILLNLTGFTLFCLPPSLLSLSLSRFVFYSVIKFLININK